MFRSHSDHPQGAHVFLIKVIDLSPAYLSKQSPRTHTVCYVAVSAH